MAKKAKKRPTPEIVVDMIVELDNMVHRLAAERIGREEHPGMSPNQWAAIKTELLRFAGTRRALDMLHEIVQGD
jgi:hypothetical protein